MDLETHWLSRKKEIPGAINSKENTVVAVF